MKTLVRKVQKSTDPNIIITKNKIIDKEINPLRMSRTLELPTKECSTNLNLQSLKL